MTADVLSDVLSAIRLTGAVYFDFEPSSPWVAEAPLSREIAERVMPGAQRVIEYHLLARGTCWAHAIGEEPMLLRLARFVGLSRTVFAERFTEMVGQPPMQYLALWRMLRPRREEPR